MRKVLMIGAGGKNMSSYQKRKKEIETLLKDTKYLKQLLTGVIESEYSSDRQDYINSAAEYLGYVACHLCNGWVKQCSHCCKGCGEIELCECE